MAGEAAGASNSPRSLAANRCFAVMNPAAIFMIASGSRYAPAVDPTARRKAHDEVLRLISSGAGWVSLARQVGEVIADVVPFSRSCRHTVDPGTVLFTGSLNENVPSATNDARLAVIVQPFLEHYIPRWEQTADPAGCGRSQAADA